MKTIYQAISIVLVALFASCNSDETNAPATPGGMTPVRFQAAVGIDDKTRANIDVDGDRFTGTWEEGDAMGVLYSVPGSSAFSEPGRFVYNDNAFAFEGELPTATGEWQYMAFYPHAAVSGNTASIPFGNLRSQKGSEFNCASDALVAEMLGFSNAKQGETDEGEPVKFRLNRLTSILNLSVQGGAGAGDAVRHILLTSENDGQPLSAQSIDFDISTLGADVALNAGARSNVIALGFDPGTAPAADAFEAYFNTLPGNYDRLTFDVITEAKQIGTVTVTRDDPGRKFAAGMLYRKEAADITFRPAEAPSLNWPDRELNDVHEITVDGNEILTYSAAITIDAPAGIAGLRIEVTSEFLNDMMGITGMDIFNDEAIQSNIGELPFSELELACTTQVQYKKSTVFDITRLLPMILMGGAENSLHVFEVHVTDLAGQETVQPLTFKVPEAAPAPAEVVYNNDADLWTNTATLTVSNAALPGRRRRGVANGLPDRQRRRHAHGDNCPHMDPGTERSGTDRAGSRFENGRFRPKGVSIPIAGQRNQSSRRDLYAGQQLGRRNPRFSHRPELFYNRQHGRSFLGQRKQLDGIETLHFQQPLCLYAGQRDYRHIGPRQSFHGNIHVRQTRYSRRDLLRNGRIRAKIYLYGASDSPSTELQSFIRV